MERPNGPAHPSTKVHAARHHEHAPRRNEAAVLSLGHTTMNHYRPIEVENHKLIFDGAKRALER